MKNLSSVLKLSGKAKLSLKTSPIIVGESSWIWFHIVITKFWVFMWCTEKEAPLSRISSNVDLQTE